MPDPRVRAFLIDAGKENVYDSVVTIGEICKGIAERWGTLTAEQRLRGRQITMADGLIAATALEYNLTLVSRNVKDFADLGVPILNPWDRD